jgi:hypothetical protein
VLEDPILLLKVLIRRSHPLLLERALLKLVETLDIDEDVEVDFSSWDLLEMVTTSILTGDFEFEDQNEVVVDRGQHSYTEEEIEKIVNEGLGRLGLDKEE